MSTSGAERPKLTTLAWQKEGERILVGVTLGMRESHEDWLCLGRDLIARGRGRPHLSNVHSSNQWPAKS